MIRFLKSSYKLVLVCLVTLSIFWPSLFAFFTNDDFYFLNITRQVSFYRFLTYFNLFANNPDGFGVYRPLTTQLFYMIRIPVVMHLAVFLTFFVILYLINKLALILFKDNKIALISTFLYAVSGTHFGHFYYLAAYQELGMTLFVLLTIILSLKKKYLLSYLCFLLALMSKETAVVAPFLVFLSDWYVNKKLSFKKYIPYIILLLLYLISHFYLYGLATGDTYIWDLSIRRLVNTVVWYLLWSLNLPETLVDFIGPGLKINPNLWIYWSNQIIPILILFFVQTCLVAYIFFKSKIINQKSIILYSILWFLISLVPVMFLPIHKFTFYLTLPLIGLVYLLSYLLSKVQHLLVTVTFLLIWTCLSIFTINLTVKTNWITQGEEVSRRVYYYFNQNKDIGKKNGIVFKDTMDDQNLPWSPTAVIKNSLSDKNFFYAFYPDLVNKVSYNNGGGKVIYSRQFLGY